jgi:hypothetical protein
MRSLPVGNPKIHLIDTAPYRSAAIAQTSANIKPVDMNYPLFPVFKTKKLPRNRPTTVKTRLKSNNIQSKIRFLSKINPALELLAGLKILPPDRLEPEQAANILIHLKA